MIVSGDEKGSVVKDRLRSTKFAVAAVAVLAVAATFVAVSDSGSAQGTHGARGWTLKGSAGKKVAGSVMLTAAARQAGVDPNSVREISSAGPSNARVALLAGSAGGQTFIAREGPGYTTPFIALAGVINRQSPAALTYVSTTGTSSGEVTSATLVGIARSDVERVVITLANGMTVDLPVNRSHGFAYLGNASTGIPTSATAYAANGIRLSTERLGMP